MREFRNHRRVALWVVCALPLAAFAGERLDRSQGRGRCQRRSGDLQRVGHHRRARLGSQRSPGHRTPRATMSNASTWNRAAAAPSSRWCCRAAARTTAMPIIEVSVPRGSSVEVSAVSADVSSRGVLGTQRLKSVSGEITADIAGDESEVRSVSGDVTVRGDGKPISLRVSSVSGSLDLTNARGQARRGHGERRCARAHGRHQRSARPHHLGQSRAARQADA